MAMHIINGVKIRTNHDYPPIPVRDMDWSAVTDDYEAECDSEGWFSKHPIGHGATEQEAIDDLLMQMEDDEPCHGPEDTTCPSCGLGTTPSALSDTHHR